MSFPAWAAATILAAEYFFFSVSFDSASLRARADVWAFAGHSGSMGLFAAVSVLGVVLVTASGPARLRLPFIARRVDAVGLGALAAHVTCLALLWWLTARVLSPSGPPSGPAPAWLTLWLLAALATPLSIAAAALPDSKSRLLPLPAWQALGGGALIGAGAWIAGQGTALLWEPLGPWTLRAVEQILRLLLPSTYYDPARAVIGTDQFQVLMHRTCSGFEGVGLVTVFVVAYLLIARRSLRFPQALLLLPLAIVASMAANVARIVTLILVGTSISPAIAIGGFHARAGWLAFSFLALTVVFVSQRLPFFSRAPAELNFRNPTAAYLLPFVTVLSAGLLTGVVTANLDMAYGVRIMAALAVLIVFRQFYGALAMSWSWTAVGAGLVAALVFVYFSPRPDAATMRLWEAEWLALPLWGQWSWTVIRVLGSVLVIPIVEELAFRGYLLRRLVSRDFETVPPGHVSLWALLMSSVAFGAIHAGWFGATLAGLLFGLVQMRDRSIMSAVVAHIVSNAAVAVYVLAFAQWWLWM